MTATLTSFKILDQLDAHVSVTANPFGFAVTDLFQMGARMGNPKRSFLFVSKLIGKHLDVHPDVPKATGYLLANLFSERVEGFRFSDIKRLKSFVSGNIAHDDVKDILNTRIRLSESTMFIGFAETATGLGHAVFSAFENAYFVHTSRDKISSTESLFDFKEEHSHAVDHQCFLQDARWMEDVEAVALIDDEITTGKTNLNLIRSLNATYHKKKYYILSLLDWRSTEHEAAYAELEAELGIKLITISLLKGELQLGNNVVFDVQPAKNVIGPAIYCEITRMMKPRTIQKDAAGWDFTYLLDTGRFGLSSASTDHVEKSCKEVGEYLRQHRKGQRTLVLGVGEFMYIPSRIAAYMGEGVTHKCTTRSPIVVDDDPQYPIHNRLTYWGDDMEEYKFYNVNGSIYDEVMVLFELPPSDWVKTHIASALCDVGVQHVAIVTV